MTLVYGLSSLTFPLDTRQFSLFYVNHLPQPLRAALVSTIRHASRTTVGVALSHSFVRPAPGWL